MSLIKEATASGARKKAACSVIGLDTSTIERWKRADSLKDQRSGPKTKPRNALSYKEREKVLEVANSQEFRDKSPKQIVPLLADQGKYICSESTMYRILRSQQMVAHREPSRAPTKSHRPGEFVATKPNMVWTWDITYLKASIRGTFFYLYMILDIWSRKIVGWEVFEEESSELAAWLIEAACRSEGVERNTLTLHSDNGGPMKAGTTLAKLQELGVIASFSRPRVSNDNPYSEACFRTVKYRPSFPKKPFESLEDARTWTAEFVTWYNTEHQHSAIGFVTPQDRHDGHAKKRLAIRHKTYEKARERHPLRWSGKVRSWTHVEEVTLNPAPNQEAGIRP